MSARTLLLFRCVGILLFLLVLISFASGLWNLLRSTSGMTPYAWIFIGLEVPFALACCTAAYLLGRFGASSFVSLLVALAFLCLALAVDPLDGLWGEKVPQLRIAAYAAAIGLFGIALPAFPDGQYRPAWGRWALIVGPLAAFVAVYSKGQMVLFAAVAMLLFGTASLSLILRFSRTTDLLQRQQMKWVALGLAGGPVIATLGLLLLLFSELEVWSVLLGFLMIGFGTLLFPLGPIVSLLRYRLNDAEFVMSRLSAYTVLAGLVGVCWTVGGSLINRELGSRFSGTSALLLNGAIAVLVLGPAKERVLKLSERSFRRAWVEMKSLPVRIADWQHGDDPKELAEGALEAIVSGVRVEWARLECIEDAATCVLHTSFSPQCPSATSFDPALDVPLQFRGHSVGRLTVGPRGDGAPFLRSEREAIHMIADPLACALHITSRRARRSAELAQALEDLRKALEEVGKRALGSRGPAQA